MAESPDVQNELDRRQPSSRSVLATLHWSGPYSAQCKVIPSPALRSSSVHTTSHLSCLRRQRLASKITKVLYIAEFVLLIQFVEVMIPVIYGLYLGAMSHLPSQALYPQLAALSEEELIESISTVMLNAGIEFISFLVACWVLHRQIRLPSLHLQGFALESQRSLIQPSLMIWTVYMIQQSLIHTGVDFTLRFAWLYNKST